MSLSVNAKTYAPDRVGQDSVGYAGPLKTQTIKDDIVLARTAPKPVVNFSGVGRTSAKLTRTHTLTGALTTTGDSISQFNVAVPVGASSADIDAILNDLGAYIASASFKLIVKNQQIYFP